MVGALRPVARLPVALPRAQYKCKRGIDEFADVTQVRLCCSGI